MGKIWGLKPSMAMWLYRTVIRPIICYAFLIWHKAGTIGKHRDKLQSFQWFALMQMGYFRKKTPGAALDVISNTMPLDLHIIFDAVCSYIRKKGHEKHDRTVVTTQKPRLKGHRQSIEDISADLGFGQLLHEDLDKMSSVLSWDKSFQVDTNSFHPKNPKQGIPKLDSDCNIYTDGSRLGPNQSGAAVSVCKKGKPLWP